MEHLLLTVSAIWGRSKDPFLLVYKGVLRELRVMIVMPITNAIPGTIIPQIVIWRGICYIRC